MPWCQMATRHLQYYFIPFRGYFQLYCKYICHDHATTSELLNSISHKEIKIVLVSTVWIVLIIKQFHLCMTVNVIVTHDRVTQELNASPVMIYTEQGSHKSLFPGKVCTFVLRYRKNPWYQLSPGKTLNFFVRRELINSSVMSLTNILYHKPVPTFMLYWYWLIHYIMWQYVWRASTMWPWTVTLILYFQGQILY